MHDPDYIKGIEQFNLREFFDAHESWEDVWKRTTGEERLFYKGLIHASVALLHFENGNLVGARKLIGSCQKYLEPYQTEYLGVDVKRLLSELQHCFRDVHDPASTAQLDPEDIPQLCWNPER